MTPEQAKVLAAHHEEWLKHPTTVLVGKWLDDEIDKQSDRIGRLSAEYNEFTGDKLQRYAMRLDTLKTVKKVIYDSTTIIGPVA